MSDRFVWNGESFVLKPWYTRNSGLLQGIFIIVGGTIASLASLALSVLLFVRIILPKLTRAKTNETDA